METLTTPAKDTWLKIDSLYNERNKSLLEIMKNFAPMKRITTYISGVLITDGMVSDERLKEKNEIAKKDFIKKIEQQADIRKWLQERALPFLAILPKDMFYSMIEPLPFFVFTNLGESNKVRCACKEATHFKSALWPNKNDKNYNRSDLSTMEIFLPSAPPEIIKTLQQYVKAWQAPYLVVREHDFELGEGYCKTGSPIFFHEKEEWVVVVDQYGDFPAELKFIEQIEKEYSVAKNEILKRN